MRRICPGDVHVEQVAARADLQVDRVAAEVGEHRDRCAGRAARWRPSHAPRCSRASSRRRTARRRRGREGAAGPGRTSMPEIELPPGRSSRSGVSGRRGRTPSTGQPTVPSRVQVLADVEVERVPGGKLLRVDRAVVSVRAALVAGPAEVARPGRVGRGDAVDLLPGAAAHVGDPDARWCPGGSPCGTGCAARRRASAARSRRQLRDIGLPGHARAGLRVDADQRAAQAERDRRGCAGPARAARRPRRSAGSAPRPTPPGGSPHGLSGLPSWP